jgi:DNA-binding HxlR family transcriptional regulator
MALRSDWSEQACPVARSQDILGDPWVIVILREIFVGNNRFDSLKAELGIADTVLSSRLQRMVEDGILAAQKYTGSARPRYEYRLTARGEDTLPVLHALARWGSNHTESPLPGKTLQVSCTTCGRAAESADWCRTCRQPLTRANTGWRRARAPEVLIELGTVDTR